MKVLGIGSALVDVLARVDDKFLAENVSGAKGGMEMVTARWQSELLAKLSGKPETAAGGAAGNTVFGLATLGVPVAIYSRIGRDENGLFYRRSLEELGGDGGEFVETDNASTGCCISMITPDSERTMRSYLGASQLSTAEDVRRIDFTKYSLVYIEGYVLFLDGFLPEVLKQAKKAGCTIALDLASFEVVNIFRDTIKNMLKEYVDIVFANEDEAAALFGAGMSENTMAQTLAGWCSIAAVKLGKRGAIIVSNGEIYNVEARLAEAVDTTGAGDMWACGFLYGWLNGCPLDKCGKFGAIVSSEVVQITGAKIPADGWTRIKAELANI